MWEEHAVSTEEIIDGFKFQLVSKTFAFSWGTVLVEDNIKLYHEKQGVKF